MVVARWLQGRRFQLWQCVRAQTEKIHIFLFLFYNFLILFSSSFVTSPGFFAMFYVDFGH